jgi:hypothetical protein
LSGETTYEVYGLTDSLGEAKGGKPKPSEENVCSDVLTVSLSPETDNGLIAIAGPWNALPRKPRVTDTTQAVYVDAVRDFLKTKGIDQPKVKIDNILRVDLDGDGEDEVLISATNYFSKDNRVPMRSPAGSYSMVLLRCVVAGKVETQLIEGEFYPKAYVSDEASFNAPNAYKVIAVLDLDGDGKMEVVVASGYYEGEATTIYRCDPKRLRLYFRSVAARDGQMSLASRWLSESFSAQDKRKFSELPGARQTFLIARVMARGRNDVGHGMQRLDVDGAHLWFKLSMSCFVE